MLVFGNYKCYHSFMAKKLLLFIFMVFVFIGSVNAGEYENALAKGKPVFLYLYTQNCGYCKKFEPVYYKVFKANANLCEFVKEDANSQYGNMLSRQLGVRYVPYVILVDGKKRYSKVVNTNCLLEFACVDSEVKKIVK